MLHEFYMVLESAKNRGATEVTLPIEIATGLETHLTKLEEQLAGAPAPKSTSLNMQVSVQLSESIKAFAESQGWGKEPALQLAAELKVLFGLSSHEIGQAAAKIAVHKGN